MEDSVVIQAERIAGDFLREQVNTSYQIIGKGSVNKGGISALSHHRHAGPHRQV